MLLERRHDRNEPLAYWRDDAALDESDDAAAILLPIFLDEVVAPQEQPGGGNDEGDDERQLRRRPQIHRKQLKDRVDGGENNGLQSGKEKKVAEPVVQICFRLRGGRVQCCHRRRDDAENVV